MTELSFNHNRGIIVISHEADLPVPRCSDEVFKFSKALLLGQSDNSDTVVIKIFLLLSH